MTRLAQWHPMKDMHWIRWMTSLDLDVPRKTQTLNFWQLENCSIPSKKTDTKDRRSFHSPELGVGSQPFGDVTFGTNLSGLDAAMMRYDTTWHSAPICRLAAWFRMTLFPERERKRLHSKKLVEAWYFSFPCIDFSDFLMFSLFTKLI